MTLNSVSNTMHPIGIRSNNLDRISRHPDGDLLEARLQALFKVDKELTTLRLVWGVHPRMLRIVEGLE